MGFQHDCAPVHKARSIKIWLDGFGVEELDWPTQNPEIHPSPLGWTGTEIARQTFFVQHQWLTSQMLYWINGKKITTEALQNLRKPSQKSGSCYRCKGRTNS